MKTTNKEIRLRLMKSAYESDLAEYREKGYISGIGSRHWKCKEYFEEFLERKRKAIEQLEKELGRKTHDTVDECFDSLSAMGKS